MRPTSTRIWMAMGSRVNVLASTAPALPRVSRAVVGSRARSGRALVLPFVLLGLFGLASPARAATANTFVLSDEGAGLIGMLNIAGYGNLNLYQALQQIVNESNPSVSGIITPAFMDTLSNCPANSAIFTTLMKNLTPGSSVAISDDCTVQTVSIHGGTYYNQPGISTLQSTISGVGTGLFTHSTIFPTPLTSWQANGNTYDVFAIAWASGGSAIPALGGWGLLTLAALLAGVGVALLRRT